MKTLSSPSHPSVLTYNPVLASSIEAEWGRLTRLQLLLLQELRGGREVWKSPKDRKTEEERSTWLSDQQVSVWGFIRVRMKQTFRHKQPITALHWLTANEEAPKVVMCPQAERPVRVRGDVESINGASVVQRRTSWMSSSRQSELWNMRNQCS